MWSNPYRDEPQQLGTIDMVELTEHHDKNGGANGPTNRIAYGTIGILIAVLIVGTAVEGAWSWFRNRSLPTAYFVEMLDIPPRQPLGRRWIGTSSSDAVIAGPFRNLAKCQSERLIAFHPDAQRSFFCSEMSVEDARKRWGGSLPRP
jgi:hypothetical protein